MVSHGFPIAACIRTGPLPYICTPRNHFSGVRSSDRSASLPSPITPASRRTPNCHALHAQRLPIAALKSFRVGTVLHARSWWAQQTLDHTNCVGARCKMQALGRSRLLNGKNSSHTVDLPSCRSPACFRQRPTKSRRGGHQRTQATPGADEGEDKNVDKLKEKFFSGEQPTSSGQKQQQQSTEGDQGLELLDGVNPFVLGRKARKQVDAGEHCIRTFKCWHAAQARTQQCCEMYQHSSSLCASARIPAVWGKLTSITSPTKSYVFDDVLESSMDDDWAPKADAATVLVVGATGRVGRILVRKLLLRGYKVSRRLCNVDNLQVVTVAACGVSQRSNEPARQPVVMAS